MKWLTEIRPKASDNSNLVYLSVTASVDGASRSVSDLQKSSEGFELLTWHRDRIVNVAPLNVLSLWWHNSFAAVMATVIPHCFTQLKIEFNGNLKA